MLRSSVIYPGCHVGLQQLEALAAAMHGFLGPNKVYKFIQDEANGDSSLVCSSFRLLECLDLSCSAGQLLNETVQAHQKVLQSGSGSLIFLTGVWSRVALECLHKGIEVPCIIAAISEGLEVCLETCRQIAVPIEETFYREVSQRGMHSAIGGLPPGHCSPPQLRTGLEGSTQNILSPESTSTVDGNTSAHSNRGKTPMKQRVKLKHSRYFSSDDNKTESPASSQHSHKEDSKSFAICHIANALSHGCEDMMNLVLKANRVQSRNGSTGSSFEDFNVDKLVTCLLPFVPEEYSCVFLGFVVLLDVEQATLLKHLKDRELRLALVKGDLSERYRHLGFNTPENVRYVANLSDLTGFSAEDKWMEGVLSALLRLGVDLLLVNGIVTRKLKDHLIGHNILAIEKVKVSVLKDFAMTSGAVPITYVTQLNERCIGTGVQVATWRECRHIQKNDFVAVTISAKSSTLVTAVITSSVHAKLQALEDQFWGCAHRLGHALRDRKVLPGAGVTELLCTQRLHKHIKSEEGRRSISSSPYRKTVLQLMMDGWIDYVSMILFNSGTYQSKTDAWTALSQQLRDLDNGLPLCAEGFWASVNVRGVSEGEGEREQVRVYDNVRVKMEVWKRALDIVCLVLQTDTEIITGVTQGETQHNGLVFL
ncbi:chaperonin-containing T-complex member BBS12 [Chanos chanos]|uniref:Chaperonin-containing T-complex member BBS12 n=1 Tax=Chanos chanos TaxID=29144 RepID=A0A6J2UQS9_CHACN|nr:Bardet-Biedl syndrome 12 protein [Chanos chanos]